MLAAVSMFFVCTQPVNASSGWQKDSKGWWYELEDGSYYTNVFVEIDGKIYSFGEDGYMVTGWYSFDGSTWSFYNSEGSMKKNAWEGNYWLAQDGLMARDQWVDGGKYYVGPSGEWMPDPPKKGV